MSKVKKMEKGEAVINGEKLIAELSLLEKKHQMSISIVGGDLCLLYRTYSEEKCKKWGKLKIGWVGNGTPIQIMEEDKELFKKSYYRKTGLSKLSEEEIEALGLNCA